MAQGGEGTGAPVHYHNTAWNALLYGAKKWFLYPPAHQIMSNSQILRFLENEVEVLAPRAGRPLECTQRAGDVVIVPESWAHGVLNVEESVAVATEARQSIWRIRAGLALLGVLPNNNRARDHAAHNRSASSESSAL